MRKTTYTIKKGRHYSLPLFPRFHWKKDTYTYKLSVSPLNMYEYVSGSPKSEQINKLVGIVDGFFVHDNSFRLGWRCNDLGKVDLFAYYYINGNRPSLGNIESDCYLGTVEFGEEFFFSILMLKNKVSFMTTIRNEVKTKSISYKPKSKIRCGLKPYNGGRETYDNNFYFYISSLEK